MAGEVRTNETRETVLRFAPKTSHQSNGFVEAVHGHIQGLARCYQTPNRDETLAYSFEQFHLPFHLQFVYAGFCALKIHSAGPTAEHHSNICLELHMYHLCACFGELVFALIPDHEVRAAKTDDQVDQWLLVGRDASSDDQLVENEARFA